MTKYQVLGHGGIFWEITHIKPKIFDTYEEAKEYGDRIVSSYKDQHGKLPFLVWYKIVELTNVGAHLLELTNLR